MPLVRSCKNVLTKFILKEGKNFMNTSKVMSGNKSRKLHRSLPLIVFLPMERPHCWDLRTMALIEKEPGALLVSQCSQPNIQRTSLDVSADCVNSNNPDLLIIFTCLKRKPCLPTAVLNRVCPKLSVTQS